MAVVDTFSRTASNGWGTSDSGAAWASIPERTGQTSGFSVAGGVGRHTHTADDSILRSIIVNAGLQDPDQSIDITLPVPVASGENSLWIRAFARYQDAGNCYRVDFTLVDGDVNLIAFRRVNGTSGLINGTSSPMPDLWASGPLTFRVRVVDDAIQAKVWPKAAGEPQAWQLTVHDSEISAPGGVGIESHYQDFGSATVPFVVTFDNYLADENLTPVIIDAQQQDVWPPRVLVSVTGLVVGSSVELYREVGGRRTPVRAGTGVAVADKSFLRVDAELPFGVPVSYVAVVNGNTEYATPPTTYTLPGGKVALTDAITGQAAEVVIFSWPDRVRTRPSSVFQVGGRNVVVSGDLGMFQGEIELLTDSTSSLENLDALLTNATEGVVQIRQAGGYDRVDSYVSILGVTESRFSQDGSDERRTVKLSVAEAEGWASALEARGYTLQDIANAYEGLTLQDFANDFATLLDVAQGEFDA